jgi:hypothetical protein
MKKIQNLHIALALGQMTDKERVDLCTTMGQLAPTSPLYAQNPHLQAAVTEAVSLGTSFHTAEGTVTQNYATLVLSKEVLDQTRAKLDRSLGVVSSMLENLATTVEQAATVGFTARLGKAVPGPLVPPDGIIIVLGKKHGQFRASAKSSRKSDRFGAQVSTDPIGPATWQDLPGNGKRRLVTGHPSGSVVWVRFRTERGQNQSDWCAPVSVTVP